MGFKPIYHVLLTFCLLATPACSRDQGLISSFGTRQRTQARSARISASGCRYSCHPGRLAVNAPPSVALWHELDFLEGLFDTCAGCRFGQTMHVSSMQHCPFARFSCLPPLAPWFISCFVLLQLLVATRCSKQNGALYSQWLPILYSVILLKCACQVAP